MSQQCQQKTLEDTPFLKCPLGKQKVFSVHTYNQSSLSGLQVLLKQAKLFLLIPTLPSLEPSSLSGEEEEETSPFSSKKKKLSSSLSCLPLRHFDREKLVR